MGQSFVFVGSGDGASWEDPTNWDLNNGTYPGQDNAEDFADTNGYAITLGTSIVNCEIGLNAGTLTITGAVTTGTISIANAGQLLGTSPLTIDGDLNIDRDSASGASVFDYTPVNLSALLTVTGTVTSNICSFEDSDTTSLRCGGCNFGIYSSTSPGGYAGYVNLTSDGPVVIGTANIQSTVDAGLLPDATSTITGTDITIGNLSGGGGGGSVVIQGSGHVTVNKMQLGLSGNGDILGQGIVYYDTFTFQGASVSFGDVTTSGNGVLNVTSSQITWSGKLDIGTGGLVTQFSKSVAPTSFSTQIKYGTSIAFTPDAPVIGVYGYHHRP